MSPLLYLASLLTIVYGVKSSLNLTGLNVDAWWGPGKNEDTRIRRVEVEFTDEMIQDLKYRLKIRRPITPSFQGSWFDYGMNTEVTEDWLKYWENEYPFKQREMFMNQFPHYRTNIQGLDVHFVRVQPQVPKNVEVVPLLLTNGWPSSFVEFYEVLPRLVALSKDRDFAVEVIYPTIPGFTLSQAAVRPGLGPPEIGVLYRKLMHRLGHKKYYMAAGDFGFFICNFIATAYPEDVLGFFSQIVSMLSIAARVPYYIPVLMPSLGKSLYVVNDTGGRTHEDDLRQLAYAYHQTTRPDTLGPVVNDSPTALLHYLLDMFYSGGVLDRKENPGAKLQDHIPRDTVLDNIMLFWITGSIGTSMRIYAETFNRRVAAMNIDETPTPVLTWIAEPKFELSQYPYWVLKTKFPNLVKYKTLEIGGHFFAYEYPAMYSNEVLTAISAFRKITNNHLCRNDL